jgi:hypothetical protein
MKDDLTFQLKQAIEHYYQQKYGHVIVDVDEMTPVGEHTAHIQATIRDEHGFITRHYGRVEYQADHVSLSTAGI